MTQVREASEKDWPALRALFHRIYRSGHPLHRRDFWDWQFGDEVHGRSIVVIHDDEIFAHWGSFFSSGYAWCINLYIDERLHGKGTLRSMAAVARTRLPIASSNVNTAALNAFRNMGFVRYCDLQRFVAIRPGIEIGTAVMPTSIDTASLPVPKGQHYWKQPGLHGVTLPDGSTAVIQANVGGIRAVEINDPRIFREMCWNLGANWIDYVTSWNDQMCRVLPADGWIVGNPIPYKLNPIVWDSGANMSFVSEDAMPKDFVIRRYDSDFGRVPSLSPE